MDIAEPFQGFFSMFHPGVPAEVSLDYNPYRELTYKPAASFSKLCVTFIPLSITGLNYLFYSVYTNYSINQSTYTLEQE